MPLTEHSKFTALVRSRKILVVLATAAILAVVGSTVGYAALSKDVTVTLDGDPREVTALGGTVGDVLEAEGIVVGEHDRVAPGLDEEIADGSRISVRFGRPLELNVDGQTQTHWVTSTNVASALGEIGRRFSGADLSTSRGAGISRDGISLEVVTPKALRVKIADKKVVERELTALTVAEALKELKVKVDKHDVVTPRPRTTIEDGDKIVFTDFRVVTKRFKREAIDFRTVERAAPSMLEGRTKVARSGRDGARDVTYRLTFRNGQLVTRKVVEAKVVREPVTAIVKYGTKEKPEPAPAPVPAPAPAANYVSGSTVWDQLAQCESGGNWAINTGNGYYGGLQFSLSTWQGYGGPGYPHQQSRETQIMIAERVRAATGGYGSWPHCSQQLGLPQ